MRAKVEHLSADNSTLKQKLEEIEITSSDLEATVSNLRNQLREKDEIVQEKTNQLLQLQQKICELEKTIEKNNDISAKKIKQLKDAEQNKAKLFDQEKSGFLKKIADLEKASPKVTPSTRQPTKFR